MKIIDVPLLVRAVADAYGHIPGETGNPDTRDTPRELLAAMVCEVLDVHQHDLYRWDSAQARAIAVTDVGLAEFAICVSCGRIDREYFWCWTMRQLYVALVNTTDSGPSTTTEVWQGWHDMAEAIQRARAAYPPAVATAVIRALNNPTFSLAYRNSLLDAVITCTQAVPAQPATAEKGSR